MEGWLEHEFDKLSNRAMNIMKLTHREKKSEGDEVIGFLWPLFDITDIGEDIWRAGQAGIPYYICSLTLRVYLEFQANLFQGAYHSAGRSLRWLYEANLAGATACISPALLDSEFEGEETMDLDAFEEWLTLCDRRERILHRTQIFEAWGLPVRDLQELYSDLCKYIHISKKSFDKELTWPNLQFIPEKFDEIFALSRRTTDLVLWLECKMLLQFNEGTEGALRGVHKNLSALASRIPMTMELLSSL